MPHFERHKGHSSARMLGTFVVGALACLTLMPWQAVVSGCEIRALLIGSHSLGSTHWITREAFLIENVLEFNGIPYDFFDIYADELTQAILDSYRGVIIDSYSMHHFATEAELQLIAGNMETGNIVAFLGPIHGEYTDLNETVYDAIDVEVDGLANQEANTHLLGGAVNAYDYPGEDGFVVVGGYGGKHVGVTVMSLGLWTCTSNEYGGDRPHGLEFALETWMEHAFGVDARVTMPVISLRLDDTQTTMDERHQEVIDFMDANKHRIRASGFLVTDVSAYQVSDSTLQSDEQIISKWGSMSLHGKDHGAVGAEGENRDYATQYSDMAEAVAFLVQYFPRHKAMKASPCNSWNEATLHAMYNTGIYYHSGSYRMSEEYRALYESVFDVDSDMERQKMKMRAEAGQLGYYPLKHSDETGVAEIYSVDWGPLVAGNMAAFQVLPLLRAHALDWWTPICVGGHYYLPGFGGANNNPLGWTQVVEELMETVDGDSYCWRRWVDTYDLAENVERFERDLTIDAITVSGDMISYDLITAEPTRFMSLKAHRTGYKIASVTIDGRSYAYFGDDYVHLPEIDGNAIICVMLASPCDAGPHVTHIDPSAVIEDSEDIGGKLHLALSGDFPVTAHIEGSSKVFREGLSRIYEDNTLDLELDVSSLNQAYQVEMALAPAAGIVEVSVDTWDTSGARYRKWTELADRPGVLIDHSVGDLDAASVYLVRVEGSVVDTCLSDGDGQLYFTALSADSTRTFEVYEDASAGVGGPLSDSGRSGRGAPGSIGNISPVPFRRVTVITYQISRPGHVSLSIHSVDGRHIVTLADETEPEGVHLIEWDGCDQNGSMVSAGLYFCRLQAGDQVATRKVVLLR